jgi:hypothetical protein
MHPAEFTRHLPLPDKPSALTWSFAYSRISFAPWSLQDALPFVRWLQQKKTCRW